MFRPENFLQGILPVLQEYRPAAVWLFAAETGGRYANFILSIKAETKSWGLKVFVQVGSVKAAREAVVDGTDVVVVQGIDAGGHQMAQGAGLMTLLPEVADMLKDEFPSSHVSVIAAGGIMDGRGIAAAQALGAYECTGNALADLSLKISRCRRHCNGHKGMLQSLNLYYISIC